MEQHLLNDITEIFDGQLKTGDYLSLIRLLDEFCFLNAQSIILKTRNINGKILNYQGTKYFSLVSVNQEKPNILAGGLERQPSGIKFPAIRFRNTNNLLPAIPSSLKFPHNRFDWTCVKITATSMSYIQQLMDAETKLFIANEIKKPNQSTANVGPRWLSIAYWFLSLIGITIAIYIIISFYEIIMIVIFWIVVILYNFNKGSISSGGSFRNALRLGGSIRRIGKLF